MADTTLHPWAGLYRPRNPRRNLRAFGRMVREWREANGLLQRELAADIGVEPVTVLYWEKAYVEPQEAPLMRLARRMDRPVALLAELLPKHAPALAEETPGDRIRTARWSLYLTREALAEHLGVSVDAIKGWELKGVRPNEAMRGAITEALGPVGLESLLPTAGVLAWPGKKTRLLPQLLPLIPDGHCYVEPYGGSASVLLARKPAPVEVYNDLNGDLANLFRVLRDPRRAKELHRRLSLTLRSRAEHSHASAVLRNPRASSVTRAWAYFVIINQGFNGREDLATGNWRNTGRTAEWWRRVGWAGDWHERLANVVIESTDALELIGRHDGPDTVFYLDPPYVASTRKCKSALYAREATDDHHFELVRTLLTLEGAVVLSGYDSPIYRPLVDAGWQRIRLGPAERVWRNGRARV